MAFIVFTNFYSGIKIEAELFKVITQEYWPLKATLLMGHYILCAFHGKIITLPFSSSSKWAKIPTN